MQTCPELSILLVSWNSRELTLECLRSIYRETSQTAFEVIVLDNASQDGSVEAIASEFPQVRIMAEAVNHGFALGTNIQAAAAKGDMLLLLNTDTVVLNGAIDRLMEFSRQRPAAKIWGGRTLFGDGSLNATSCWGSLTLWNQFCLASGLTAAFRRSRLFNPRAYPGWNRDSARPVDIISGCFLLMHREFWNRLGGFDPMFFMYGEDTDLCMRAVSAGASPAITPDATIIHYGGGSTRSHARKICQISAAHISIIKRHFSIATRKPAQVSVIGWVLIRHLAFTLLGVLRPAQFAEQSATWSEAWSKRSEWRNGYCQGNST